MRPTEDRTVVGVVLRRTASPPCIAVPAPPQINHVPVQHGLAVGLQRSVAGETQRRCACRRVRHARGIRSHAERQRNTQADRSPANFRVIPGIMRRLS